MMQTGLGWFLERAGKFGDAEAVHEEAVQLWRAIDRAHPKTPDHLHFLGGALHDLAELLLRRGAMVRAWRLLEEAVGCQRAALAVDPDHPARVQLRRHCRTLLELLMPRALGRL
jgi:hypothetical protein